MEDLARYQGLLVFGLGIIVAVAMFALRAHILAVVESRFGGAASADGVKALDTRLHAHEGRLASIESSLQHLPTSDQLHSLALSLSEMRGEMRAVTAGIGHVEKAVAATGRRVELIDEHLKRAS